MQTYIALLRAINVSGKNTINMDQLRTLFEDLGFTEVQTWLQSGNVVFASAENNTGDIAQRISNAIKNTKGYNVGVLIMSAGSLKQVLNGNPFLNDPDKNPAFMHVTFLESASNADAAIIGARASEGEDFLISGKTVYLYCPFGYGRTKLTNSLFESKLKTTASTRNWKTVTELVKMSRESG